jgi:acid stress-induced BolA-like protein IbaG/YrbA
MNADDIRKLIEEGLPDARVEVQGEDGVHFEARVVSAAFAGKLPLARHRMVYATLGERMGGEIHALALRTLTPEEAAQASG